MLKQVIVLFQNIYHLETTKSDFISTQLLCSNRDLPHEALSQANNILNLNDSSLARRAVVLKRPNKPYYFEQNKKRAMADHFAFIIKYFISHQGRCFKPYSGIA